MILTDQPLFRRKNFLEGGHINSVSGETVVGVVLETPGRIEFPFRKENATTPSEIRLELDAVMERKGEGVILKKHNSRYIPNSRDPVWMKVRHLISLLSLLADSCTWKAYQSFFVNTDQARLLRTCYSISLGIDP
jgi:ATP-dependent DNA ligase